MSKNLSLLKEASLQRKKKIAMDSGSYYAGNRFLSVASKLLLQSIKLLVMGIYLKIYLAVQDFFTVMKRQILKK